MSHIKVAIFTSVMLAGCGNGGGGGTTPSPSPSPTPMPTPSPWAAVKAEVEAFSVQDVAVVIGDATGTLFTIERGDVNANTPLASASSAKLLAGLTMISLIEKGALELGTGPADILAFWNADDQRSAVTLQQLLSFTSGFHARPTDLGCWNLGGIELQECARLIYADNLDAAPGTTFSYGPEHLHIAAAMAEVTQNAPFVDIFRTEIADPLNLTPGFRFETPSVTNPRVSGGAVVNAADYALILKSVLAGELVSDQGTFFTDFSGDVNYVYRPNAAGESAWRYGLGYWVECDLAQFSQTCLTNVTISSPGAFGFTPWVDFEHGYFGVIAMEEASVDGGSASAASVSLEQTLQPLIEEALAQIR